MTKIKSIIKAIEAHDKIAIFHHENIDGDSWSCSYGFLLGLKTKYPNKEIYWIANEVELKTNFGFLEYEKTLIKNEIDHTFLAIIGDTSSINKVVHYNEYLKAKTKICFDHHQNQINIEHDLFWHEPTYPASALQTYEILKELKIIFNEVVAFNLLIGLLTDTGNFTYSLANPKPPIYFGKLLKFVSNEKMNFFWNSMKQKNLQSLEIEKLFLNNLEFNGNVAYIVLDKVKTAAFDANINFKIKINLIGNIEGYPIWAIFIKENDLLKIHLRSNGPNVAQIAIAYGGGGHIRAAGAKITYQERLIEKILKELNSLEK